MKTVIKKYGTRILGDLLSLSVFLVAVFSGGKTERLAPFIVALLCLICAGLLILKSARYLTLPFLHLSLLLIFCYDSYSFFINYTWLLPIVIVSMAVYLVRRKPPFLRGASFWPLVAISVATLCGGIGMIPPEDYFRPASLVFMAGLGPGLILSYWIMKNELQSEEDRQAFLADLLRWGLTAAAISLQYVLPLLRETWVLDPLKVPQWSNNISTMLMIALPAAFASKKRHVYHYLFAVLMLVATLAIGSRGGQLFVSIEFVICSLWVCYVSMKDISKRKKYAFLGVAAAVALCLIGAVVYQAVELDFFQEGETRFSLLSRGFADFCQNPLFGSGLGYRGNSDLFQGKQGTINWYHIFISQVVGGLGICGILAWSYQLYTRFCLALRARRSHEFGFALCYLGLFFMSMVNPGEFCPVPYAFLAVCFFAALENHVEQDAAPRI